MDWIVLEYVGIYSRCLKFIFPPILPLGGTTPVQKLFSYLINRFLPILAWIVSNSIEIDCHYPKFKFKFFSLPSGEGTLLQKFLDSIYRLSPNLVWILINGVEIEFHCQKWIFLVQLRSTQVLVPGDGDFLQVLITHWVFNLETWFWS